MEDLKMNGAAKLNYRLSCLNLTCDDGEGFITCQEIQILAHAYYFITHAMSTVYFVRHKLCIVADVITWYHSSKSFLCLWPYQTA